MLMKDHINGPEASKSKTPDESEPGFTCPHCRNKTGEFHYICPACGRPLMRDYIDWRMYPRDPELQGTWCYHPFWARIWLILAILGLGVFVLVMVISGIQ